MKLRKASPLFLLLMSNFVTAQVFTASGVGDSPEAAKKDAITNAIKLSVGEIIVSKEELNNDEFTQKIVSYSDAYVKKVDILSQVKLPNGAYQSEVNVDIESQKLTDTLKERQIKVVTNVLDNDSILEAMDHFDSVQKNKETEIDFTELVKTKLVDPINENRELVHIELLSKLKSMTPEEIDRYPYPKSEYRDLRDSHYPFSLNIKVTPDENYIKTYRGLLDKIKNKGKIINYQIKGYSYKNGIKKEIGTYQTGSDKIFINGINGDPIFNIARISHMGHHKNLYTCIKLELIDKLDQTIKILGLGGGSNVDCTEIDGQAQALFEESNNNYWRSVNFIPKYFGDDFISGSLNLKVILFLTKEEILSLKDIKVFFDN